MGKVSPPSIKYIIYATFTTEGVVEKPDVIGAVFGQTEGLLGEDLELRELQKKGKIGRIDATLNVSESKTSGTVEIPTSIDKAETAIIAAAIETIDRIGPCDARFEIKNIEDVRTTKRDYIVERAKKLMENLNTVAPSMKELEQNIITHTRVAKVREYGKELLAAGPDIESAQEIIVVEGRADVVALLRAGIKNAIAMNGTSVPQTIKELSKKKQITLFIDGDRGGLLIAKDVLENVNVAFIARAPDGKEVEELTEKELISCLRNRMTLEEFSEKFLRREKQTRQTEKIEKKDEKFAHERTANIKKIEISDEVLDKNMSNLQGLLYEIDGTKSALILGVNGEIGDFKVLQRVSVNESSKVLLRTKDAIGLVLDGNATLPIIRAAEKKKCKLIVAKNFTTTSRTLRLISF